MMGTEYESIIKNTIKQSIRKKLQSYKPETSHMPFHHRLLGRDRMALFSFIHSLNTTFGTSIFEPVAEVLAGLKFKLAKKQYIIGDTISEKAQMEIQHILNDLTIGKNPNKHEEIERIRKVCNKGNMNKIKDVHTSSNPKSLNNSSLSLAIFTLPSCICCSTFCSSACHSLE